jgi:hypothetical protein
VIRVEGVRSLGAKLLELFEQDRQGMIAAACSAAPESRAP